MREITESRIDIGEVELSVVEWQGDGDPVLLLHATGFHSRCWNEVVKRLPGQHIYAVDLRFHGGSGAAGEVDWKLMVEDIRILVERLDLRQLVGVGHSIGGHLVARVAAALPGRFKQLLLIDPVIMSPERYAGLHEFAANLRAEDHPVTRRKNRWQDADEMYQRFRKKPPFDSWDPRVLRDYCDYALRPSDESGVMQLQCDPINEASIYLRQAGNEIIHGELPLINTPVTLLRAPPADDLVRDLSASPTWPDLASALPCCREIYLPDNNHFIPMQDPALVAQYIQEAKADQWQRVEKEAQGTRT
jgi:pimeloyl-ACP methyl ester carboxylesterase